MIASIEYNENDIENFLEFDNEMNKSRSYSKIFDRLLEVQNKIPILKGISKQDLKVILQNLKFTKHNYKEIVIKEGEVSQEIFFILSGECQVFVNKKKVGDLKPGKSFGEIAAIFHKTRNATVACSSQELMLLSFKIDNDNMDFCAPALATLYKNLAYQINNKLESMNVQWH